MDVPRPQQERDARRRRRRIAAAAAVVVVATVLYGVTRIGRAEAVIDRDGLWIDTVREGDLARELHGVGELVPIDDASRWISAEVEGRVDRKLLEAGAAVRSDTVLLVLSNPDVSQASVASDLALDAAVASYASLEVLLRNELLALRSSVAAIDADATNAALRAEVDATMLREGLVSEITARQSGVLSQSLQARVKLEHDRVIATEESISTRLAAQRSEVAARRTVADLRRRDLDAMTVRAGLDGVLQEIVVEVGQRVTRNANLARAIDPNRLKARLRIPEAQTTGLRLGLPASIDTHNGLVAGRVSRVAPAAQNGTVTVDVGLEGALPRGARVDMTVDGTIELDRLAAVRHVGRPASGTTEGPVTLFKVSTDGTSAQAVRVTLEPAGANTVRIVDGDVRAGDRVVLSDTSAWSSHPVVRLR